MTPQINQSTGSVKKPFVQDFGPYRVFIVTSRQTGQRAAKIVPIGRPPQYVPLELLALGAGPDAWMRKVQFKCKGCGTRIVAQDGEGEYCTTCYNTDFTD